MMEPEIADFRLQISDLQRNLQSEICNLKSPYASQYFFIPAAVRMARLTATSISFTL